MNIENNINKIDKSLKVDYVTKRLDLELTPESLDKVSPDSLSVIKKYIVDDDVEIENKEIPDDILKISWKDFRIEKLNLDEIKQLRKKIEQIRQIKNDF